MKVEEQTYFKCIFYFFKIFGIAPLNLKIETGSNTNNTQYILTQSRSNYLYSVFLICVVIIWNFLTMWVFQLRVSEKITYDARIYEIIDTLGICSTIIIIIIFCAQSRYLIIIFNQFIDTKNVILVEGTPETKQLLKKITRILFLNLFLRLAQIATIGYYGLQALFLYGGLCIGYLVKNAIIFQYVIILKFLEILFAAVNENLLHSSNDSNLLHEFTLMNEKLTQIYESHVKLRGVSKEVSYFYSFPMLLCILCDFLTALSEIYFIAKPTFTKGSYSLQAIDYIHIFLGAVNYAFSVVILTSSVRNIIDKSTRISKIMFDCLQKIQIREIKNKMRDLCSYFRHDKVNFTIYDFFSLDGTLLVSITGVMTTYLVILLQFQP